MVVQQEYADELNQLFKSINAWSHLSKASFDYQLVLADIWIKAFTEVIQVGMYVSSKVQQDLPPTIVNWLKARAYNIAWLQIIVTKNTRLLNTSTSL